MPLEKRCGIQINAVLDVVPVIGFGWSKSLGCNFVDQQTGIDPPLPFRVKIAKFHSYKEEIRAASGVVECEGHPLQGRWASLVVRDGGGENFHNFTDKAAKHNVCIGTSIPTIEIQEANIPMVDWVSFEGGETVCGMAYVAESRKWLQELFEWIKDINPTEAEHLSPLW